MMNRETKLFIDSIKKKIKKYSIDITLKKALSFNSGSFVKTEYTNGVKEIVDPTIEWMLCKLSPYYFIDRYCWISFPGIGDVPFYLYYFQRNVLKDFLNFRKVIFLKVRQSGLSTLSSLYALWKANFHESEYIDVVSLKQLKAQAFVSKMDPTLKRLPTFLKTPIVKDNTQEIEWENGSTVISESQSENAGRSDSLSLLVLDEAAHYRSERMVRGIVAAAQPTLSRTGGQFIIISTPNRTSGSGSYYYEQVSQAQINPYDKETKLIVVDWWEVPDMDIIPGPKKGYNELLEKYIKLDYYNNPDVKKEANEFFEPIAENWRENDWLRKQHEDLGDVLYKQEILHRFIVSEQSVFNEEILNRFLAEIKDPVEKDKIGRMNFPNFWIWKKPIPNHRYILTVDVSTGTGKDSSAIEVFDVGEYEQVAEYKGMISTKSFGRAIKAIAKYYNEAFVVIECNSIGEAVFNEVYYHETEPYNNVYRQKKTKNGITRMTGWITDVKTRKLITNELIDWLTVDSLWEEVKIYSKRVYLEMTTWIWDGSKPIHDSNTHDDLLIALSLALYLRNKAINSGESFLINEEGNFIEYNSKDKAEEEKESDLYGIIGDFGEEEDNIIKERYGMSKEEYDWLVG